MRQSKTAVNNILSKLTFVNHRPKGNTLQEAFRNLSRHRYMFIVFDDGDGGDADADDGVV